MSSIRFQVGDKAPDFDFETPWLPRKNFYETMENHPAVLVFLRYLGCPVCQMDMAQLKREIGLFTQKDAKVFVFLQSPIETVASAANDGDWPFYIVCDPKGAIFREYAVEPGGLVKYLHPAGLIAAVRSTLQGYRHGKFEGNETQLPAAFVLDSQKIITYAYYGKHINDLPEPALLAAHIR